MFNTDENSGLLFSKKFIIIGLITIIVTFILLILTKGFDENFVEESSKIEQKK